jgi:hypothetical protein
MYEFSITVGMKEGGEEIFIVSAEAKTSKTAEDKIRYLAENSLKVLGVTEIKIGG